MIKFPNCKINIGLKVCRKRPDGFHNLQTFFYPIPIFDILEIVSTHPSKAKIDFSVTGFENIIPGENICVKAYNLLKENFTNLPSVKMHLHKVIPIGAGLGGGSADGAFTLLLLNELFELQIPETQLMELALKLGSDCPFFILNQPAIATGRGENLIPVGPVLRNYKFLIINPGIEISTAAAFSWVKPKDAAIDYQEAINSPVEEWKNLLFNDFEMPVFEKYPDLQKIKEKLYHSGAVYAGMSGTGSTIFGIFPKDFKIDLKWPAGYFVKEILP